MVKIINTINLEIYFSSSNFSPFIDWLESIDNVSRYRIKERLDRISLGNFGDYKYISDGIYELRFNFSSGYRIYYGINEKKSIVLLFGGDKSTQNRDIKKAISFWFDYLRR